MKQGKLRLRAARRPAFHALLCLLFGFALPLLAVRILWPGHEAAAFGGGIVLACAFGAWLRLPLLWLLFILLAPVAALIALGAGLRGIPSYVYVLLTLALLLIFWNVLRDRVPLYLSNDTADAALLEIVQERGGRHFADLGCGLGGTALHIARHLPRCRVTGVETAPFPYAVARLRAALSRCRNIEIRYCDLWDFPLEDVDVAYAFLSPAPMEKLIDKAMREMRPGSLFVSNSFAAKRHPCDEVLELSDGRHTRLLLWHMGKTGSASGTNSSRRDC